MKRRNILKGLGLGIGGASVPLWFSAFGLAEEDEEFCEQGGQSGPMSTEAAAEKPLPTVTKEPTETALRPGTSARPRLYLVIPKDRQLRRGRGQAFGELFNHGDERALARLAIFEVVCATTEQIKSLTGRAVKGEPWLVVVDRGRKRMRQVPLHDRQLSRLVSADAPGRSDDASDVIDERIRRLGDLIAIAADPVMIERIAAVESRLIQEPLKEELSLVLEQLLVPRMAVVEAAPATILKTTLYGGDTDDEWIMNLSQSIMRPRLAELTRDRLVRSHPPEGARWARTRGCGVRIEGVRSNVRIGCGMGHVPERSQRFLSFLVDAEED